MPRRADRPHVPVLLEEVRAALEVRRGDTVADVTVGLAGHALPLLRSAGKRGRLVGLDLDPLNLEQARAALAPAALRFDLFATNFAALPRVLGGLGLAGVDALVADLGVASTQIDDAKRGFSFLRDGPLDMRMDPSRGRDAADLLADIPADRLAAALREFADEEHAHEIAQAVAEERRHTPIRSTRHFASVICRGKGIELPKHGWGRLHPAALAFQAVRMLVNRELDNLRALLRVLPSCLNPGGRAAIISFHSGEDRLVKHAFREGQASGLWEVVSDEPVRASEQEAESNPRSWSARLRVARRGP
jgi:16S rRNA (cytosine1402-N4)-methyltransferase